MAILHSFAVTGPRWRCEEKLRIVAEVERPGASFADVARRHEVSRGLLWNWRRQVRAGVLGLWQGFVRDLHTSDAPGS